MQELAVDLFLQNQQRALGYLCSGATDIAKNGVPGVVGVLWRFSAAKARTPMQHHGVPECARSSGTEGMFPSLVAAKQCAKGSRTIIQCVSTATFAGSHPRVFAARPARNVDIVGPVGKTASSGQDTERSPALLCKPAVTFVALYQSLPVELLPRAQVNIRISGHAPHGVLFGLS